MKNTTSTSKFFRVLLWVGGILGGFILLFAIAIGVMLDSMGNPPSTPDVTTNHASSSNDSTVPASKLDYSTTRTSDNGLFNVSYTASTGAVPVNQMHQWTLHVETIDGQPVENATIRVDGDMPEHGHGLPTRPRVTEGLGGGDYLVEGMKFQMGGWWVMDFVITANGQSDTVHFNMKLK